MTDNLIVPLIFLLLIPFSSIGITLISTGLNRTRNAAHTAIASVCAGCVSVLAFVIFGSAICGVPGQAQYSVHAGRQIWAISGAGSLFSRSLHSTDPHAALLFIFQLLAVSLTAQIPIASGAERWRLIGLSLSSALLAGVLFPFIYFWVWGGGFLSQVGDGVIDSGGAGVVNVLGGLLALVIAWILGPRQGKFTAQGIPTAMPGHNAVLVVTGSLLALIGWTGLTCAGAVLFYRAEPGMVFFALINTLLAASAGAMSALLTTRLRFGKPDTSLTANGWVGGLVACSAGAPFYKLSEALLVGVIAGFIVVLVIEVIELKMRVDDPAGAIAVHAGGGIWGLLAAGIFAGSHADQFLTQLTAIGTLIGFAIPFGYSLNSLINRFVRYRVDPAGERQGLDLHELGAGAYPEFVTHREEYLRR